MLERLHCLLPSLLRCQQPAKRVAVAAAGGLQADGCAHAVRRAFDLGTSKQQEAPGSGRGVAEACSARVPATSMIRRLLVMLVLVTGGRGKARFASLLIPAAPGSRPPCQSRGPCLSCSVHLPHQRPISMQGLRVAGAASQSLFINGRSRGQLVTLMQMRSLQIEAHATQAEGVDAVRAVGL